jgi:formylglycine-generating enzyme required for sulfatase activity
MGCNAQLREGDFSGDHGHLCLPVTDPEGATTGPGRVVRGGSWYDGAGFCRSALRTYYGPEVRDAILGFRLAASVQ